MTCSRTVDDAIVVSVVVVYILQCADRSLYVGHTTDLAFKLERHNQGFGSSYTASRRPVSIIYKENFETLTDAVARERQLKGWSAAKKRALAAGNLSALRVLSRRRSRT
jgi:putative endonuclease